MATHNRRTLALLMAVVVTAALTGSMAWGAPVPSQSSCSAPEQVDAKGVAAERELVKGKLMEFGLTDEQAGSRVELLTDQEVHTLAADLDKVQIAGDTVNWDTTTVLLLLLLVVLIAD